MAKIRVLVVDDSAVVRRVVSACLACDPDLDVVGVEDSGQGALAKIPQVNPEVVTLDLDMPGMNGLQTLRAIRKIDAKLPVIIFSVLTERGASATLDALSIGANDYVTNVGDVATSIQRVRADLIPKIKSLCRRVAPELLPRPVLRLPPVGAAASRVEVLAIGASTGGPNALVALMPGLPRSFPVPILIVQHMPELFTRLLAERLEAITGMRAREGVADALLRPGEIWVAPGGRHMEVERTADGVRLRLHDAPPENSCRPAVDVLFRSVAKAYGPASLSVVLTGMGEDGLRGCEHLRQAGGQVLAQVEASSVVWGMPGAVANAGLAHEVRPLLELPAEINRRLAPPQSGPPASVGMQPKAP